MSRSADNDNGTTETSHILGGNDIGRYLLPSDYDTETPLRTNTDEAPGTPGHRKVQSLFAIPTGGTQRHHGRHHRHMSSIGQFMESIGEGIQDEAVAVRRVWKQELEDGDLGRRYFFDMNLTRSLSVLPEDIQEFSIEAVGRESTFGHSRNSPDTPSRNSLPDIPTVGYSILPGP